MEIEEPQTELGYQAEEVIELARVDMDFFAALAIPEIMKHKFPQIFKSVWALILSVCIVAREFPKIAIGLPRGIGKTTVIKLAILYMILLTDKKFILVVCATSALAENVISDVCDMLDSPNIKTVFGDWRDGIEKDTAAVKKFAFRGKDIILQAAGAGTNIRGVNLKWRRPDVIITDDIQKKEEAKSPELVAALMEWFVGTLMKAKSPDGCIFLYIGNMYEEFKTHKCILQKLQDSPDWTSFIVGAILADGTSIWPELKSVEELMAEFRADVNLGMGHVFIAEVLNDPRNSTKSRFDSSKVPLLELTPEVLKASATGKYMIIDPSAGIGKDTGVIALFYIVEGIEICVGKKRGQFSPKETINTALEWAVLENCPLICVENVAYQSTLLFWFQELSNDLGIEGICFFPVKSGGIPKATRVLTMFKRLLNGELLLGHEVRDDVLYEATAYRPDKAVNVDDLLDALAYSEQVICNYSEHTLLPISLDYLNLDDYSIAEDNTCF